MRTNKLVFLLLMGLFLLLVLALFAVTVVRDVLNRRSLRGPRAVPEGARRREPFVPRLP